MIIAIISNGHPLNSNCTVFLIMMWCKCQPIIKINDCQFSHINAIFKVCWRPAIIDIVIIIIIIVNIIIIMTIIIITMTMMIIRCEWPNVLMVEKRIWEILEGGTTLESRYSTSLFYERYIILKIRWQLVIWQKNLGRGINTFIEVHLIRTDLSGSPEDGHANGQRDRPVRNCWVPHPW